MKSSAAAAASASALQVEFTAEILAAVFPMLTQDLQVARGCGDDPPQASSIITGQYQVVIGQYQQALGQYQEVTDLTKP